MGDSGSEGLSAHGDNFRGEHLEKGNPPASSSPGEIRKAVAQCLLSSSSTFNVSRKNIKHLIEEIYRQPSIKYFHLERNVISTVPRDLFQKLPHLVWLDLRYNKITALPPGIGHHRQLKTLLLEKNPIKELPAELGNVTALTASNLRHCPLEFPPKAVVRRALRPILRGAGCRRLLRAERAPRESGNLPNLSLIRSQTPVRLTIRTPRRKERQLNLSELLQCGLDLLGEWPDEEEEPSLERPSGAALQGTRRGGVVQRQPGPAALVTLAHAACCGDNTSTHHSPRG